MFAYLEIQLSCFNLTINNEVSNPISGQVSSLANRELFKSVGQEHPENFWEGTQWKRFLVV
jgi:hypothetical protein